MRLVGSIGSPDWDVRGAIEYILDDSAVCLRSHMQAMVAVTSADND